MGRDAAIGRGFPLGGGFLLPAGRILPRGTPTNAPRSPEPLFSMKTPSLCLLLTLSLSACGDPPTIVDEEPRVGSTELPLAHPPQGASDVQARSTFSASGTVELTGVEALGERACLFVTIRSVQGPLWLAKQVPLAGQASADGVCTASWSIDESNTMMGGPAPSGALTLHVLYSPIGVVEDPDRVAAEPVPVKDGDTGIAIELSAS